MIDILLTIYLLYAYINIPAMHMYAYWSGLKYYAEWQQGIRFNNELVFLDQKYIPLI